LVQELTAAGFSCRCERDKLHPGATEWLVYCSASAR
jgi:hypothetical protein